MSLEYLVTWMMVLLRTMGVVAQLPIVANRPIPTMAKVGMGMCIATLLAGIVPVASVPLTLWPLLLSAIGEVLSSQPSPTHRCSRMVNRLLPWTHHRVETRSQTHYGAAGGCSCSARQLPAGTCCGSPCAATSRGRAWW